MFRESLDYNLLRKGHKLLGTKNLEKERIHNEATVIL